MFRTQTFWKREIYAVKKGNRPCRLGSQAVREAADASPAARQPPHGGAQMREVGGPGGGNSPRADAEAGGGAQQQPAQFSCDFGCGFHGGFDAVQEHEQACRLRPWSSPATTDDAQSIRAWSEHAGRGDGQV